MPPSIDELIRRNVIRQWISGFPRDKIAEQNNVGAGTVSSIIANYKAGLEELDFDSIRQLAVEARQHGWNFTDLTSHARLHATKSSSHPHIKITAPDNDASSNKKKSSSSSSTTLDRTDSASDGDDNAKPPI
jgi:hypothetical protein